MSFLVRDENADLFVGGVSIPGAVGVTHRYVYLDFFGASLSPSHEEDQKEGVTPLAAHRLTGSGSKRKHHSSSLY